MKKLHWLIAGAVVVGVVMGASLAARRRSNSGNSQPQLSAVSQNQGDRPSPELTDFPHQRLSLVERAQPGSDFYGFRQQLRQAVAVRDAEFIKSIQPPQGIAIGEGSPQSVDALNLDDPKFWVWLTLEKAIAISCAMQLNPPQYDVDPSSEIWVCPNVAEELFRQYPPPQSENRFSWAQRHVAIVGENVNARSQPTLNSSVVGVLSNEIVEFDERTFQQQRLDGWTPVILPNQRRGYVYNRYVYFPLANRVEFGKVNGKWRLLSVAAKEKEANQAAP